MLHASLIIQILCFMKFTEWYNPSKAVLKSLLRKDDFVFWINLQCNTFNTFQALLPRTINLNHESYHWVAVVWGWTVEFSWCNWNGFIHLITDPLFVGMADWIQLSLAKSQTRLFVCCDCLLICRRSQERWQNRIEKR